MKTLHLIRHAKSSWKDQTLSDIERPLNKRGHESCRMMAANIYGIGGGIQGVFANVYVSAAHRAQLTMQGLQHALIQQEQNAQNKRNKKTQLDGTEHISWLVEPDLYTFSWQELLSWCQTIESNPTSADMPHLTLVGHNPALEELVSVLCGFDYGTTGLAGQSQVIEKFATGSYAQLQCNIASWAQLGRGSAQLKYYIKPKDFQ
ncbi:SixA phosphatase family protein [Shewanella gelidii]|uniref:Phosphoglycerate mutase n=1 Tax=Shewanella gelidii TaxID=1642821 RepID=A0A917JRQ0_9GAMM|nr:hypothetical protein [Shewanella gelidii]MCL1098255.1 hypothetical protein [Shewanella gelidii]GGI83832.1 phosphoglycerate mutase [Shewanella gelidii]